MKERKMWTKQQDQALMFFKEQEKIDKWCDIAKLMKQKFGKNARNQKQCRDRYVNHLRLKKPKTQWKKEDQEKIIKLHKILGNKWVAIAQHFDGMTQIFIKNQFYSRLRKSIRKLNKHISQSFRKEYKEFKLSLIFKLASVADGKLKKLNEICMGLSQAYSKFLYILISFTSDSVSEFLAQSEIYENFVLNLIKPLVSFERISNLLNKYRRKRPKTISNNRAFGSDNAQQYNFEKNIQSQLDQKIGDLSQNAMKQLEELLRFQEKYLQNLGEVKKDDNKINQLFLDQKLKYKSSVSQFKKNQYSFQKNISGNLIQEQSDQILNSQCIQEGEATSVVEQESSILEVLYEQKSRSMMFFDDVWMNESQYSFFWASFVARHRLVLCLGFLYCPRKSMFCPGSSRQICLLSSFRRRKISCPAPKKSALQQKNLYQKKTKSQQYLVDWQI